MGRKSRRPLIERARKRSVIQGSLVCAVAVLLLAAWTWRGSTTPGAGVTAMDAIDFRGSGSASAVLTETIGYSLLGRPIEAFTLGSGPVVIAVIGGLHTGTEMASVEVVEALYESYRRHGPDSEVTLVFVPLANPDGKDLELRANARGVDLNRNWPSRDWSEYAVHSGEEVYAGTAPLSEPETAALFWFLNGIQPAMTLSFHGYAGVVDDNGTGPSELLARAYAAAAGYEHIEEWDDYHITGQMIDSLAEIGLPAADIELGEGDPLNFARNAAGLRALIDAILSL